MKKWTEKIPSFLWIFIIIGGIALFLGAAWGIFYGLGYIEGFGSIAMLIMGWIGFRIGNRSDEAEVGKYGVAVGISFFALMGMALDQTGNVLYNYPMESVFCDSNSDLVRETMSRATRSGNGVQLTQNFQCVGEQGEVLRKISMFEHLIFRLVEYIIIGYILLGLSRLYSKLRRTS